MESLDQLRTVFDHHIRDYFLNDDPFLGRIANALQGGIIQSSQILRAHFRAFRLDGGHQVDFIFFHQSIQHFQCSFIILELTQVILSMKTFP